MLNIDIMREIAALAGYTIDQSTGQDATNKTRAQRRVNTVKADIISRYGGKWDANYREGWLPIVPLYNTGTVDFTNGSRTVTGHSTAWDSTMKDSKILATDGAYYKIASVTNPTTLILTQPFQGVSITLGGYQIWKDEYVLYPEVLTVAGFVDYFLPQIASETYPRNMKDSYPRAATAEEPTVYTIVGRKNFGATYSTGTISGSSGSNVLTGLGTAWLANIEPGFEINIGGTYYHVRRVNSDTELELYQLLKTAVTNSSYSAVGKNAIIVRFRTPTTQRIVHYWYWAKDYPFVNDSDEDWIAELFPEVVLLGAVVKDYMDKNDLARLSSSKTMYEDAIKGMKVAIDNAMTGVRTLGYYLPPEARE